MITQTIHSDSDAVSTLCLRCADLGLGLISVSAAAGATTFADDDDPLLRALLRLPLFESAIRQQMRAWDDQPQPQPHEIWPGCWALPAPMMARRRRVGYFVAVLIGPGIVDADQFNLLCAAAKIDSQVMARRLRALAPVDETRVRHNASILQWMVEDLQALQRRHDEIHSLSDQLGATYEELSLLYNLSTHMMVTQDPFMFLQGVCVDLVEVLGVRWIALMLSDDDPRLKLLKGRVLTAGRSPADPAQLETIGRQLLHRFGHGSAFIVDDSASLEIEGLEQIAERLVIVPMMAEGKPLGVLFAADKLDGSELSTVDSKLVTSAVQNMGIFLENAMLYEDMQDMFMGSLHALVSSIDAKDTYTCGHSERVALLSRQLAQAAGLDAYTVERVYLSGLVHDVGKIGVPESVLCKPGRLTADEFEMMKAHPDIGVRILGDIRQMADLLPGVRHHHERWDGRGYPLGLAGADIPLFGRLIALADSFDAMSSNRTYRKAMPLTRVLQEISDCAGSQFDPDLAAQFVKLDFEPFKRLLVEHQQRQTPLSQVMRNLTCA